MNYYIFDNDKIVLFDTNKEQLQSTLEFMPQYEGLEILETERKIVSFNGGFYFADEIQEELSQAEAERIAKLKCTKRVFALMLQELGIDYLTVLLPLIESNPQAKLEWDLCVELERSNPLLDIMAGKLGVTPAQLDGLFRYANGEITFEEFIPEVGGTV